MRLASLSMTCLALLAVGCEQQYPGQSVGTFQVMGTLQENTCGEQAVPAVDPLRFPIEIRKDQGRALWRRPDAPLVSGTITPEGAYRFTTRTEVPVGEASESNTQQPQCVLEQRERIELQLEWQAAADAGTGSVDAGTRSADAGTRSADGGPTRQAAGFEGINEIQLSPVAGSDCGGVGAVQDGPFRALPCRIEYDLQGTPRMPF